MRFAAISDIHSNRAALEAVLADMECLGVTEAVNLGDSLSGPMDGAGCADILIERDWPTVSGNHDWPLAAESEEGLGLWEAWVYPDLTKAHRTWIAALPATRVWNGVFLAHGTPTSDDAFWMHEMWAPGRFAVASLDAIERAAEGVAERLMLCGHTHVAGHVRLSDGRLLVNPGSVGCPGWRDERETPPVVNSVGAPDARYAILEETRQGWDITYRSVPYDTSGMIELARAKGADDWVEVLQTGWAG